MNREVVSKRTVKPRSVGLKTLRGTLNVYADVPTTNAFGRVDLRQYV